jgi:hypothetical protein
VGSLSSSGSILRAAGASYDRRVTRPELRKRGRLSRAGLVRSKKRQRTGHNRSIISRTPTARWVDGRPRRSPSTPARRSSATSPPRVTSAPLTSTAGSASPAPPTGSISATRCASSRAIATRPSTSTTGYVCVRQGRVEQLWPITAGAQCINACRPADHEACVLGVFSLVRLMSAMDGLRPFAVLVLNGWRGAESGH